MTSQKSRLLFLLELLNRETDEQHPITIAEIMARLNAEGFTATRKTATKDIDTLLAHGVDVVCNKGRQNQYFIGEREFELPELTMLVDAVQAAKFIPVRQSQTLPTTTRITTTSPAETIAPIMVCVPKLIIFG